MSSTRYSVTLLDPDFYQRPIPCQDTCLVRTDARGYVSALARGAYEQEYFIARETKPPHPSAGECVVYRARTRAVGGRSRVVISPTM